MVSHVTIVPASTQAGKNAIASLLSSNDGPTIRGIYRDPAKAPAEHAKNPRFEAVKGDVTTGAGLDFSGTEAVFYTPPPTFDGELNNEEHGRKTAGHILAALKKAPTVKRLVLHSALGAHRDPSKLGVLRLNHVTDEILKGSVPEVIIVKPCNYYQNWAGDLKTMQADPPKFDFPFSPADLPIPMISAKDVGAWAAKTLLDPTPNPAFSEFRLFGPRSVTPLELKAAIESVTGKPGEMTIVAPEKLNEFWGKLLPEKYVQEFVDFNIAQLEGGELMPEYEVDEKTIRLDRELVDDLREMAGQ